MRRAARAHGLHVGAARPQVVEDPLVMALFLGDVLP